MGIISERLPGICEFREGFKVGKDPAMIHEYLTMVVLLKWLKAARPPFSPWSLGSFCLSIARSFFSLGFSYYIIFCTLDVQASLCVVVFQDFVFGSSFLSYYLPFLNPFFSVSSTLSPTLYYASSLYKALTLLFLWQH